MERKTDKLMRYLIPGVVLLVGLGFMLFGIKDGEAAAVIKKAVAICMECIGIG
ncbi:MAG: hypothetical protein IJM18_00240 [Clostridia bacterium]|jgi:hypothetical protein|nr:hypothetical protein [Clostridia bacterium]